MISLNMQMKSGLSKLAILRAQWRIILALMLHDIRTRVAGNAFGFLLMGVGWPLSHVLILLLINIAMGRTAPFGDSTALWYATGIVPFMAFQYSARYIMLGIVLNRSLLSFPTVKITDILFARALIEVLNAGIVVSILFIVFWAAGIDFLPVDVVQASSALLVMMLLGLGFGIVNAIIAGAIPFWITGYALVQIILWIASGVLFVPDALPEVAQTPLSYIPPLQGVEWMRSAYYTGYGAAILDKTYLISFAIGTLFIGFALERLVRGRVLG